MTEHLYFDANAGVAATARAVAAYRQVAADFANPSSSHELGRCAAQRLTEARATVARCIGAQSSEIVFTSGGTESDALAILGVVGGGSDPVPSSAARPHVVASSIEHAAVAKTLERLVDAERIDVTFVEVGRNGRLQAADVAAAITSRTRLVSIVAACNETGVIQPVAEICGAARSAAAAPILVHTDAVQAIGRMQVEVGRWDVDLLSISGHKLGAVSGVGALYVRQGLQIQSVLVGGSHEGGRRASTENVAGAASLAAAIEDLPPPSRVAETAALRDRLEASLSRELEALGVDVEVLGAAEPRLCNTSCVRLVGCEGDGVMMALDLEGIAISTGSACSSGSVEPSPILLAMGLSRQEAKQTVRFSLTTSATTDEVDRVSRATVAIVGRMSKRSSPG